MATEYAGPFNGSTIATAQQFRLRNRPSSPDGVDADFGATSLAVTSSAGTSVDFANGRAIVQGAMYELSAGPKNIAVSANGGGSNRFDIAVLTYDSAHTPGVYARVIEGTPGAGLPALTNSDTGTWDMPLAHWEKTPAGAIVNLVDRRFFLDGNGGLIGKSQTGTQYFPPAPRRGQRLGLMTTAGVLAAEYRWSGAFWERVDPLPLLEAAATDGGDITSTSWSGSLSGGTSLSGTFTGPLSGRVKITHSAAIGSGDYTVYVRVFVTGPGLTDAPDITLTGSKLLRGGGFGASGVWGQAQRTYAIGGCTPGSAYTATMQYIRTGSGSNQTFVDDRRLLVERA
jgi:hypothetical protein